MTSTLDLLELLQSVEGAVDLRAQSVTLLGSWQVAEANRSADSIRLRTLRDSGAFPAEPIVFWESSGGYGTTTNFLLQHFPSLGRAMGSPWDHTVRVYDSEWYGRVDVIGNALASGVQTITAPPLQIGDVTFDYRAEIPTTTLFWWGVINAEDEMAALVRYLEREGCGCNANLAAFPESLDFVCGGGPDVHIWDTFLDPARARAICPYAPEWCLAPDGLRNFLLPLFTDMDGDPASEGLHFHIGVHVVPIDTLRNVP